MAAGWTFLSYTLPKTGTFGGRNSPRPAVRADALGEFLSAKNIIHAHAGKNRALIGVIFLHRGDIGRVFITASFLEHPAGEAGGVGT